jgi:hypothetical protein
MPLPCNLVDLLCLAEVAEHVMHAAGAVAVSRLQATCTTTRQLVECPAGRAFWRAVVRREAEAAAAAADTGGSGGCYAAELHRQPERIAAVLNSTHPPPAPEMLHAAVVAEHRLRQGQDLPGELSASDPSLGAVDTLDWHAIFLRTHCAESAARRARRGVLRAALAARGLELRADSWLCRGFIRGEREPGLAMVVDTMAEMHFFHTCTPYPQTMRRLKRQLYTEIHQMCADARAESEEEFSVEPLYHVEMGFASEGCVAEPVPVEEAKHAAIVARLGTGRAGDGGRQELGPDAGHTAASSSSSSSSSSSLSSPLPPPPPLATLLSQAPPHLRPRVEAWAATAPRTPYMMLGSAEEKRQRRREVSFSYIL